MYPRSPFPSSVQIIYLIFDTAIGKPETNMATSHSFRCPPIQNDIASPFAAFGSTNAGVSNVHPQSRHRTHFFTVATPTAKPFVTAVSPVKSALDVHAVFTSSRTVAEREAVDAWRREDGLRPLFPSKGAAVRRIKGRHLTASAQDETTQIHRPAHHAAVDADDTTPRSPGHEFLGSPRKSDCSANDRSKGTTVALPVRTLRATTAADVVGEAANMFSPAHDPIRQDRLQALMKRLYTPETLLARRQRSLAVGEPGSLQPTLLATYDSRRDAHLSKFWKRQELVVETVRPFSRQADRQSPGSSVGASRPPTVAHGQQRRMPASPPTAQQAPLDPRHPMAGHHGSDETVHWTTLPPPTTATDTTTRNDDTFPSPPAPTTAESPSKRRPNDYSAPRDDLSLASSSSSSSSRSSSCSKLDASEVSGREASYSPEFDEDVELHSERDSPRTDAPSVIQFGSKPDDGPGSSGHVLPSDPVIDGVVVTGHDRRRDAQEPPREGDGSTSHKPRSPSNVTASATGGRGTIPHTLVRPPHDQNALSQTEIGMLYLLASRGARPAQAAASAPSLASVSQSLTVRDVLNQLTHGGHGACGIDVGWMLPPAAVGKRDGANDDRSDGAMVPRRWGLHEVIDRLRAEATTSRSPTTPTREVSPSADASKEGHVNGAPELTLPRPASRVAAIRLDSPRSLVALMRAGVSLGDVVQDVEATGKRCNRNPRRRLADERITRLLGQYDAIAVTTSAEAVVNAVRQYSSLGKPCAATKATLQAAASPASACAASVSTTSAEQWQVFERQWRLVDEAAKLAVAKAASDAERSRLLLESKQQTAQWREMRAEALRQKQTEARRLAASLADARSSDAEAQLAFDASRFEYMRRRQVTLWEAKKEEQRRKEAQRQMSVTRQRRKDAFHAAQTAMLADERRVKIDERDSFLERDKRERILAREEATRMIAVEKEHRSQELRRLQQESMRQVASIGGGSPDHRRPL